MLQQYPQNITMSINMYSLSSFNKTRESFHLQKVDDQMMVEKASEKYNRLTNDQKIKFREMVVSNPDRCSGRPCLKNHRLWIELIVFCYLNDDMDMYEIDDYDKEDLENICAVWFFEIWMNSEYYKLDDYVNI